MVVVATALDPSGGMDGVLFFLVYGGIWAAAYGALYAAVPGSLCGVVIGALAELRIATRLLVLIGAAGAAAVGWLWVDLVVVAGVGPTLDGRDDLLLYRAGPAAAGACGGAWQAVRTAQRASGRVG